MTRPAFFLYDRKLKNSKILPKLHHLKPSILTNIHCFHQLIECSRSLEVRESGRGSGCEAQYRSTRSLQCLWLRQQLRHRRKLGLDYLKTIRPEGRRWESPGGSNSQPALDGLPRGALRCDMAKLQAASIYQYNYKNDERLTYKRYLRFEGCL